MTKTRTQNRIQIYDKNAYKIAYKCMKTTRIQMYEKKQAYKCMKKTRRKMYEKNRHTNV